MKLLHLAFLCIVTVFAAVAQERQPLEELPDLGLQKLVGRIVTYCSEGARERAKKAQADLEEMAAFYEDRLGIRGPVILGVLNPSDWEKVYRGP